LILLKDLTLYFSVSDKITGSDMKDFSQFLNDRRSLENLRVDFSETEITDVELGFLVKERERI